MKEKKSDFDNLLRLSYPWYCYDCVHSCLTQTIHLNHVAKLINLKQIDL